MAGKRNEDDASLDNSPRLLALFMAYLHWYMPRHFHALRISGAERFCADATPVVACINHPSWWDPLTILMLSRHLAPERFACAPMEAEALKHYGFFRRLGAFAVDNDSPRAGAQFLRRAKAILAQQDALLWTTPEGKFCDVRTRPVAWKSGTAALTRLVPACTVVPVAIEYTFWDERLPEILCLVGEPVHFAGASESHDAASTDTRNARLENAMAITQDELAVLAKQRNSEAFTTVFAGRAGVSAFYNLWQRVKSALRGTPYRAEHGTIAPKHVVPKV